MFEPMVKFFLCVCVCVGTDHLSKLTAFTAVSELSNNNSEVSENATKKKKKKKRLNEQKE